LTPKRLRFRKSLLLSVAGEGKYLPAAGDQFIKGTAPHWSL